MRKYSEFFQTLHDEVPPYRIFGRGTHYSVLRAVVFSDSDGNMVGSARFLDFAIIWDEDHDHRVIEPLEKIYLAGLLPHFLMFGERKGGFSAIATADSPQRSLLQERLNEITQKLAIGDSWHTMVGTLDDPGAIISENEERVSLYLSNMMMLWRLGIKPATYEEITTSRAVLRSGQSNGPDGVVVDPLA